MDPEHSNTDTNETGDFYPRSVESVELQQNPPSADVAPPRFQFRQRRRLPIVLFVATCMSTWLTGVILEWEPTDKPVVIKIFALFTIEGGKISHLNEVWNKLDVMKQIGFVVL